MTEPKTAKDALLPCPFCGGNGKCVNGSTSEPTEIRCENCKASVHGTEYQYTKRLISWHGDANKKWNTRAQPEQAPSIDEHCKDCCCAKAWEALGITEYTGKSIPEHILELKALTPASDIPGLREAIAEKVLYEDALQYLYDFTGSKPIGSTEYQIHMYIYSIFQSAEKGEFND